jgi:hypothetical protein
MRAIRCWPRTKGVLTSSNPAHVLLAAGLAVAIVSQAGAIVIRLSGVTRRIFATVLAVFAVTIGTALGWSEQESLKQSAAAGKLVADTRAGIVQYRNVGRRHPCGHSPVPQCERGDPGGL